MKNNVETVYSIPSLSRGIPKWIFLQLLQGCNLHCKMCYEWGQSGVYREKEKLSQLDIDIVKKIIIDCSPGKPHYELFGGEPLIYPHFKEVMETIRDYGSTVDMPTNGTLLEDYAEMLVALGMRNIYVSLDGPEDINDCQRGIGVYQKAVRGMKKLFDTRVRRGSTFPKIGIGTTVTSLNYRHIERFFMECIDVSMINHVSIELQSFISQENYNKYKAVLRDQFGIQDARNAKGMLREVSDFSDIDISKLSRQLKNTKEYLEGKNIYVNTYPKDMSKENIKAYFSPDWDHLSNRKKGCIFTWIVAEVNAEGNVTTCHPFYDLTLGNVYNQSLIDIWNGSEYKKLRQYVKKQMLPICPACCFYYNEKPVGVMTVV